MLTKDDALVFAAAFAAALLKIKGGADMNADVTLTSDDCAAIVLAFRVLKGEQ